MKHDAPRVQTVGSDAHAGRNRSLPQAATTNKSGRYARSHVGNCPAGVSYKLPAMTFVQIIGGMGQLFALIRQLVAEDKYVIGWHASERLDERGIMEWQVVASIDDGVLLLERPDDQPNPVIEVRESLPDGTDFKAVWAYLPQSGVAKLVTVHYFD